MLDGRHSHFLRGRLGGSHFVLEHGCPVYLLILLGVCGRRAALAHFRGYLESGSHRRGRRNRTTRSVSIPVPPTSNSLGFADKDLLVADGEDTSELYFIVIKPDGRAARRTSFLAQRKAGELSKAKRLRPGLYRFTYTAPRGLTARQTRLTVAVRPNPEENRQTFAFRLTAGRPDKIEASARPATLPADGRSRARLAITVADRTGNPLDDVPLTVSCEPGVVGQVSGRGQGRYRAIYTAPVRTAGRVVCALEVESGEPTPLRQEFYLELIPPVPAVIEAQPGPRSLCGRRPDPATHRARADSRRGGRNRRESRVPGVWIRRAER